MEHAVILGQVEVLWWKSMGISTAGGEMMHSTYCSSPCTECPHGHPAHWAADSQPHPVLFFSDELIFVLEHHRKKKSQRNVEVLLLEAPNSVLFFSENSARLPLSAVCTYSSLLFFFSSTETCKTGPSERVPGICTEKVKRLSSYSWGMMNMPIRRIWRRNDIPVRSGEYSRETYKEVPYHYAVMMGATYGASRGHFVQPPARASELHSLFSRFLMIKS